MIIYKYFQDIYSMQEESILMNDKCVGVGGKVGKVQWILEKLMLLLEKEMKIALVLINDDTIVEKFKIL